MGKCCGSAAPEDTAFGASQHRVIKVVIIGDSGVGKTTLLRRFIGFEFDRSVSSTVSCDFQFLNVELGDEVFKAQMWDTSGQERFNAITKSFYRNADAAVLVYSERKRSTFERLRTVWLPQLTEGSDKVKRVLIIGNQTDLLREGKEPINEYDMTQLCKDYKTMASHMSAKKDSTGHCQEVIDTFCQKVVKDKFGLGAFEDSSSSSSSSSFRVVDLPYGHTDEDS